MRVTWMGLGIGALLGAVLLAACSDTAGSENGSGGGAGMAGAAGSSAGASSGGAASGGTSSSGGASGTGGSGKSGSAGDGGSGGTADCGCVDQAVSWNYDGGFVAYRETNTLEPCRTFTLVRSPLATDPPDEMCTDPMESCEGTVNPADIQAALEHADVVAAFAAAPILFGRDTRPVDGQVLQIHLGDQAIEIGQPCSGAASCTDEPEGVVTLRTLLSDLVTQLRGRSPCNAL